MPNFKKSSGFKMKGSPLLKDVKMYQGDGSQIIIDNANLGKVYMDENGNKTRDYTYTTKDGKLQKRILRSVMGFKMGTNRGLEATAGEIKTKMRFGKQSGEEGSVPGTPVIRVPLEEGIMGEANMDGSIYVNENIIPVNHEMRHATDMKLGKLTYTDNSVTYNGEEFPRMDIDGVDSILVDGEWKEAGDTGFPWEDDANNGNH